MPLVKHTVLYSRKNNENSTTPPDPVGAWVDGKLIRKGEPIEINLEETSTHCLSYDDDQLVKCNAYSLCEVELPEWLSVDEWVANVVVWKWAWSFGTDPAWPEAWQRALAYEIKDRAERLACTKLLNTKKFKSEFRQSLQKQLIAWLDTPADKRTYPSPFSHNQWNRLVDKYTAREARQRDEVVYLNRSYVGAGAFVVESSNEG